MADHERPRHPQCPREGWNLSLQGALPFRYGIEREDEPTAPTLRPFIKWAGGKQALADTLVARFPERFDRYFEPFIGGGSVFFTLRPKIAVLADRNGWLIDTYDALRRRWSKVASILETLPNTRDDFLRIRSMDPDTLDRHTRAAHFIYLNKTCFRGLFRVNRQGRFNVPYGAYARRIFDRKHLEAVSQCLQGVQLRHGDFEEGLRGITSADFAYLDPPYVPQGGYSDFNRYTDTPFVAEDQARLAARCKDLDRRGVRWLVSQSDTPLVRDLYSGFRQDTIEARREINLKSERRAIGELVIANW